MASPHWRTAKRERDKELLRQLHLEGGECFCGRSWSAELHHLKRRSQGGGDTLENLAWLCHEHHFKLHAGTLSEEEKAAIHPIQEPRQPTRHLP